MLTVLCWSLPNPFLFSLPARPPSCAPISLPFVSHSSLNSVNSSDSRSSGSHSHSPSSHYRYRSSNLPQQAPMRLSSVSSHDSGFMSQDAFQSKSPSPMPPEAPNQVRQRVAPFMLHVFGSESETHSDSSTPGKSELDVRLYLFSKRSFKKFRFWDWDHVMGGKNCSHILQMH